MRTNIVLDEELVEECFELTGARTKRELVHLALEALKRERRPKDWRDLVGRVRFYEGYDHKELRRLRTFDELEESEEAGEAGEAGEKGPRRS